MSSLIASAALAAAMAGGCRQKPPAPVEIAVTADAAGSGLVQSVVGAFAHESGVSTHLVVVPSDQAALERAQAHDAQVVFTTVDAARYARVARLSGHFAAEDFAIVGPANDPARIDMTFDAPSALRAIAKRGFRFCSAADLPVVRQRELDIWTAAGIDPKSVAQRVDCRGDIASVVHETRRRRAYAIVDAAGAAAAADSGMKILLRGTPRLRDDFTVILADHEPWLRQDKDAQWLVEWLMSYRGRDAVDAFHGKQDEAR